MHILVSGVAGDIGLGVGRILKNWGWSGALHGIDVQVHHAAPFVYDHCAVAPRAEEPRYLPWLLDYINSNDIELFIPTSEAEIKKLAIEEVESIGHARILLPNKFAILKSLDKFECLQFISAGGISVPENGLVGEHKPSCYPVIVKPRFGQGSKNILLVDNESEYLRLAPENRVWQEYLADDSEEYTCPVYRSARAGTRTLVMNRKLQGGLTASGKVVDNEEIVKYVASIASALQLDGVINVQLRMTQSGPKLFEVNPRLSSTLVFRDKMGFCDLRWWLTESRGQSVPEYVPVPAGTRFYRGAQEYIASP